MSVQLNKSLILDKITSSDGVIPLAAERLSKETGQKVTEYDVIEAFANDPIATKEMSERFRSLSTVKLFELIVVTQNRLTEVIDELAPKEVARLHASLLTVFNNMTSPATKTLFDIDAEALKIAQEFDMDVEEARKEIKDLMREQKAAGKA